MISGFFIFNYKGDVLISRIFREDIQRNAAEAFRLNVIHARHEVRSPVNTFNHDHFFHMSNGSVYMVMVTKENVNAAMCFELMNRTAQVMVSYFGKFNEESVKTNFVLIYELLDEILDYGYPQMAEANVLKLYITQEGIKTSEGAAQEASKVTMQATGAINWRSENIRYKRNEIFIDVVESVNLLMSPQGKILHTDVSGQILMRSYLSGMPECRFGLNDKIVMDKEVLRRGSRSGGGGGGGGANAIQIDDVAFHQCVKLGKYESDRSISFVPPDGEFELMRYRTTSHVDLPFRVIPIVKDISSSRIEAKVVVKSMFSPKLFGTNIQLLIPTPTSTANVSVHCSSGKAKYKAAENGIIWKIKRFSGGQEYQLSAEISLIHTTEKKVWNRPPISMSFQVPMFTSSGLQVRFLKVFESKLNYDTVKWVRYLTKGGSYETRI
eukprot:Nk52_evm31s255 gene=Nk52_evmTU31s255